MDSNVYSGKEILDYDPKGDVYTMKKRKTTFEEPIEFLTELQPTIEKGPEIYLDLTT